MMSGRYLGILVLALFSYGGQVAADHHLWNPLRSSLAADLTLLRGGSSPFQPRVAPKNQGRPGRFSQEKESYGLLSRRNYEGEDMVEDDAATREEIDAFLTRDSRNSFIGKWTGS